MEKADRCVFFEMNGGHHIYKAKKEANHYKLTPYALTHSFTHLRSPLGRPHEWLPAG